MRNCVVGAGLGLGCLFSTSDQELAQELFPKGGAKIAPANAIRAGLFVVGPSWQEILLCGSVCECVSC